MPPKRATLADPQTDGRGDFNARKWTAALPFLTPAPAESFHSFLHDGLTGFDVTMKRPRLLPRDPFVSWTIHLTKDEHTVCFAPWVRLPEAPSYLEAITKVRLPEAFAWSGDRQKFEDCMSFILQRPGWEERGKWVRFWTTSTKTNPAGLEYGVYSLHHESRSTMLSSLTARRSEAGRLILTQRLLRPELTTQGDSALSAKEAEAVDQLVAFASDWSSNLE